MGSRKCLEDNVLYRGNFFLNAAGEGVPAALALLSSTLKFLSSLLLLSQPHSGGIRWDGRREGLLQEGEVL